jgi:hypothetical protein
MIPEQICKSNDYSFKTPAPCKQLTWIPGVYTVKLHYIKNGEELANRTINFSIGGITQLPDSANIQNRPPITWKLPEANQEIGDPQRLWLNPQPEPPKPWQ